MDYFKFKGTQGQRILAECMADALDSRLNPVVILYTDSGKELDRSRRGGLIDFMLPQDGDYVVAVHDFLYRGGNDYFYRLHIHDGPHLDYILPASGQPGTRTSFTVYGRNLPGGESVDQLTMRGKGLQKKVVEIDLPEAAEWQQDRVFPPHARVSSATLPLMAWRLQDGERFSNPVYIGAQTAPVILETEPNNGGEQAQHIQVPGEYTGQLYPARDRDWITFDGEQGKVYWLELISERLGNPSNGFLLVQKVNKDDQGKETVSEVKALTESGNNIGGRQFNTSTRDPMWKFEVKETGTYRVMVKDMFAYAEPNPAHVYRLSIREAQPDFQLVAFTEPPLNPESEGQRRVVPHNILLRKGQTWPIKVLVLRRDGFDGEIQLHWEGLPDTIQVQGGDIPKGATSTQLFLTAPEDVTAWHGPLRIRGEAKLGDQSHVRHAISASVVWSANDYNNESFRTRLVTDLTMAITDHERGPVILQPKESKTWSGKAEDKIEIPLLVKRVGEFNQALKFRAVGDPELSKIGEFTVDGKAGEAKLTIDLKKHKIPAGKRWFSLRAVTKGKHRARLDHAEQIKQAAAAAKAKAEEADKQAKAASEALKQADTKAMETAETLKAVEGKLAKAKDALAAKAEDESLKTALAAAQQEVESARGSQQTAAAAQDAARKANEEAAALAKSTADARTKAEALAKSLEEQSKPKDVSITVYSTPIHIEVLPAEKKVAQN